MMPQEDSSGQYIFLRMTILSFKNKLPVLFCMVLALFFFPADRGLTSPVYLMGERSRTTMNGNIKLCF